MLILKAPQSEVLAAVRRVSGVAGTRSPLPIISNILLRKAGSSLSLTATDLEIEATVTATLGGDEGDFATTISAKRIVDVLQTMPSDQVVSVTEKAGKLVVQAGRSRFNLNTLAAQDFPAMRSIDEEHEVTLQQSVLRRLLEKVAFAMALHDVRYFLCGMLLEIEKDGITAVATDGSHLAKVSSGGGGPQCSVILPRPAVIHLLKLLADDDEPVTVRVAKNAAVFEFGTVRFVTKLVEGRFPDYRRALPASLANAVTVGRGPMLHALRAASIVTTAKFKGIRLEFSPGEMRFKAQNDGEDGESAIEIDYAGPEVVLGFDSKLLAEGLDAADGDMVRVEFTDDRSPLLMSLPNGDASYRYVLMPMRI